MNQQHKVYKEEQEYLEKAHNIIRKELIKEEESLGKRLKNLVSSGKAMWEDSIHYSDDFEKLVEMNQYLAQFSSDSTGYLITRKKISQLKLLSKAPYFGRFDFREDQEDYEDKIYIGTSTLTDSKTDEIIIYDWRAPISSMFYSCEAGRGAYKSPRGITKGDILLKRQYKISGTKLKYFFDSSLTINDDILQDILSQNSSNKMKSIVETIQKEQDVIIRDTVNDLVIVQGVAGSGKTSVALHRIAFMLYEGLTSKLNTNDILIISPNNTFSSYISNVLPQLGEENVEQLTFEDIIDRQLPSDIIRESRHEQLERLIQNQGNKAEGELSAIEFKGSSDFVELLNRYIKYYESKIVEFKDIYYNGKIIEKRELLRDFFLKDKINMPLFKRLERIEGMIFNKIKPFEKERRAKILKAVEKCSRHPFDMVEFSRLMSIKESGRLRRYLQTFAENDSVKAYIKLFENKNIFLKLAKGLRLPENIDTILEDTLERLQKGQMLYEDCAPYLYLKFKIEGNNTYDDIKQVVIDEAQDYYPINYHIFKLLFKNARMTLLGDFNQCLEKAGSTGLYEEAEKILNRENSVKLSLNKGYRSSYEIYDFNRRLLDQKASFNAFERHEELPQIKKMHNIEIMEKEIIQDVQKLWEAGYKSVSLICKTMKEAQTVFKRLSNNIDCNVIDGFEEDLSSKLSIIPAYLSKGLEFDCVLVYNASDTNYKTDFDRRLLYIACSRPLHRLGVYYTGNISEFLK